MVQKIVDDINNCLFENKKEKFDRIVEGLNHENENFLNSDPWVLSDHLLKLIIMKNGAFNKKALLNVGKNLKFENFLEFTKTLIPQSKYEW